MMMQEKSFLGYEDKTKPKSASAIYEDGFCKIGLDKHLKDEILQFAEKKKKMTMPEKRRKDPGMPDEDEWKQTIRRQMEEEIDRRVREALATPPMERQSAKPKPQQQQQHRQQNVQEHTHQRKSQHVDITDLTDKEREYLQEQRWRADKAKRKMRRLMSKSSMEFRTNGYTSNNENTQGFQDGHMTCFEQEQVPNILGFQGASEGIKNHNYYARIASKAQQQFGKLTAAEKHEFFYTFTKNGFSEAMRTGHLPDGSTVDEMVAGRYVDKYGIIRDEHGPFWPPDHGPLFPAPVHQKHSSKKPEPLLYELPEDSDRTITNQQTPYEGRWRGVQIVFDSERSGKDYQPAPVSEGQCPSLTFESRFESGNLRQARRIGQYEYELVLRTDLYTKRHTQWYYFRVKNAVPGVTYKFVIVNLLKRNSLYNYGMRPLLYSEKNAQEKGVGWLRAGHHIRYCRNTTNLHCPLLSREIPFYMLMWQMEFPHEDDTYYLAHCYPYTYSDLKDDLDTLLSDPGRSKVMRREVMCETRAGNSCFLVTVTNFDDKSEKKGVVVSARVHPGETQASWMMKGLLEYITSSCHTAKQLRNKFIFKIVPMLNPDGVIVGNYRCSLAARDLNRNYRHPRRESFPTVWHTKAMMEEFGRWTDIIVYCDLHGHSRKNNVFMYGCNSANQFSGPSATEAFLNERLFPWLMAQKAPDKFSFNGCKFQIKRCKESTGRVVMYRQMNISNSFTMEATFSGSTICKGDKRHFNLLDFQDMGRVFCEVALEYQDVMENKTTQSEVVLDLTRAITHQILAARGMLPAPLPDFSLNSSRDTTPGHHDNTKLSASEQLTASIVALVAKENKDQRQSDGTRQVKSMSNDQIKQKAKEMTKMDVVKLIDNMSVKTIDGCIRLLDNLNVKELCIESDSSDSDSESEPEMKYSDQSKRKKKKKKKSRESKEMERKSKGKDSPDRPKSLASLPAITPTNGNESDTRQKKKQSSSSMNNYVKKIAKQYPTFVNKYQGRSNGGIPCFSEERSLERANRRMADMQKRIEDEKQRQQALYLQMDPEGYNSMMAFGPSAKVYRANSLTELNQWIPQEQSRSGLHIRTGYMHAAGEGAELSPGIQQLQPGMGEHALAMNNQPGYSTSESDTDEFDEEAAELPHRMPFPALTSPYQSVKTHMNGAVQPFIQPNTSKSLRPQQGFKGSHPSAPVLNGSPRAPMMSMGAPRSSLSADVHAAKMYSMPTVKPIQRSGILSLTTHKKLETDSSLTTSREYTDMLLHKLKHSTLPMGPMPPDRLSIGSCSVEGISPLRRDSVDSRLQREQQEKTS